MVAWQQGRTIYMKLLLDSSTDSKIVTRTNQNHASFASIFLLKCWVWWKGGVCRFSANNFLLCTDPQRHREAGGSDSYDRHLVNGLLTSCLCGAFQVSFCTFRISFTSHYHLQGWGSSSDGAEKIFCNSPNKLKTENVNVDFVTISYIVEGWKYIWSCCSMVLDKPGHS